MKSVFPDGTSLEKLFVLEVHHYFHEETEPSRVAKPTPVELSPNDTINRRVEMPETTSRRVTRAMTREHEFGDDECPPLVRRYKKPTFAV